MCSSENKSVDDLPGIAPKGSPLIHDLVLLQSSTTVKIVLDQRESGEVRSKTGQSSLFHQRDDGYVSIRSCGRRYGGLCRAKSTSMKRSMAPRNPKMQDRRIISVYWP